MRKKTILVIIVINLFLIILNTLAVAEVSTNNILESNIPSKSIEEENTKSKNIKVKGNFYLHGNLSFSELNQDESTFSPFTETQSASDTKSINPRLGVGFDYYLKFLTQNFRLSGTFFTSGTYKASGGYCNLTAIPIDIAYILRFDKYFVGLGFTFTSMTALLSGESESFNTGYGTVISGGMFYKDLVFEVQYRKDTAYKGTINQTTNSLDGLNLKVSMKL